MKKLISKILVIMVLAVMAMPLTSNAGFQANKGGTSYKTSGTIYANDLFEGIRNMETTGGTLGLNAKLQETTYLDTTNNGLDCHMAKNTEWGTAAMLSASIYGTAPEGISDDSTTGNDSGIFQMARGFELVAGIKNATNDYMGKIRNADARYYDLYETKVSKAGDATTETVGWKKGQGGSYPPEHAEMFVRDCAGLFGFGTHHGNTEGEYCYDYSANHFNYASARAVVVCGYGL